MKELWKKFDRFMLKYGGYALLVATLATAGFLAVLQWANDYMEKETAPLNITLDEDGYLSVDYQYDDKEGVFIYWETDAGKLNTENNDVFTGQDGYFVYSKSDGKVMWSSEDADGNTYKEATVRAVLYEENKKNIYEIKDYVMELTITLKKENGTTQKAEDRVFSNPVREDGGENWEQIYVITETDEQSILRYRTGKEIKTDETLILCWMAEEGVLSEVDYAAGMLPNCQITEGKENLELLKASTVIAVEKEKARTEICAGLIDENVYQQETVKEEELIYPAKWIGDKK